MLKFVILVSAIACALGAAIPDEGLLPQLDGRIVGGKATTIDKFAYQISLQRSGSHYCGGSIYNSVTIVTAAHCVLNLSPSIFTVRAGSSFKASGGDVLKVASITVHAGYNSKTNSNDVAIIKLATPLTLSTNVKTIPLATKSPANGAAAVVSGWGALASGGSSPSQLQYVDVKIVSVAECRKTNYGSKILADMICAGDSSGDACQGDSGGPLVVGGQLVGIVSWGTGCAAPNYPGVYGDVAVLRSWIVSNA